MLAHIYYLFKYVLTDTKNSNFCVMKVKDFIEFIRPITAVNPDTEIGIYEGSPDKIVITDKYVSIIFDIMV